MDPIVFTVPIFLRSLANARDGSTKATNMRAVYAMRARHAKEQRDAVTWRLAKEKVPRGNPDSGYEPGRIHCVRVVFPIDVKLTRIAKRELDDDNLANAFKHVRDAIATWFRVDDRRMDLIRFMYAQETARAGVKPHVRVAIVKRGRDVAEVAEAGRALARIVRDFLASPDLRLRVRMESAVNDAIRRVEEG